MRVKIHNFHNRVIPREPLKFTRAVSRDPVGRFLERRQWGLSEADWRLR